MYVYINILICVYSCHHIRGYISEYYTKEDVYNLEFYDECPFFWSPYSGRVNITEGIQKVET